MGRCGRQRPLFDARGRDPRFKSPRTFEASGIRMHDDGQTVIKERIYVDKANKDVLIDEITTIDNALTRPWTVTKRYVRETSPIWSGISTIARRTISTSISARRATS